MVSFVLQPLYHRRKEQSYPLDRRICILFHEIFTRFVIPTDDHHDWDISDHGLLNVFSGDFPALSTVI
jgi:hypothetical protein